ncbi:MAG TPA: type II toxin-antitoxin system HicB family antitoxin [Polyangia bacterium]
MAPRRTTGIAEVPIQLEVERLAKGGFRATSPDVPGLFAQGRTLAETVAIAQDVARKLVESCLDHGDPLPRVFTRRPRKRIPVTAVVALTGARRGSPPRARAPRRRAAASPRRDA